ncbi:hypothetical protein ARMSODRAFT_981282 [Armillaria solidipes]|uniref:F-box domain-containing protein n=1 Tax=Armillaria solidipes TaxID=1076256 RepID=A0A2H3AVY5_9AGAR|nr:hypothetical protein ARMSODRAFT_981282 [Armillaria solidipes]
MPQLDDEYLTPAHVSMYLENNDAPHDIDVEYITNSLRDITRLIEKADEDEKELSRALETLRKRRTAMLQTQSKLRSIISPLRRFPAEILSEIFHHTVERDGYSVLNTADSPWSLSHVNHHWRATALSFIRFSVYFDYPEPVPTFKRKAVEIAQLLIDNCERWYSLEISNHSLEINSRLGKVRGHIPNLTRLVIHRGPLRASPIAAFELAPQLRTVRIHGNPSIILPWLRHFQGSHRDLIQSVTTPNLESFHLDDSHFVLADSLLDVRELFIRSRCSGLSKLTLSDIAMTSHILDILPLVPALAVLQFQFCDWRDRDAQEDIFRSMLQQMTDHNDVGTLKVVPNLREFSFTIVPPRERRDPYFTPVLCFDGIFIDMVASRAETLEKVEVKASIPNGNWIPVQVSIFEGLLQDGMDISLKGLGPWDFSL